MVGKVSHLMQDGHRTGPPGIRCATAGRAAFPELGLDPAVWTPHRRSGSTVRRGARGRGGGNLNREAAMRIVEQTVSAGDRSVFDVHEFLSRPLFAHLA